MCAGVHSQSAGFVVERNSGQSTAYRLTRTVIFSTLLRLHQAAFRLGKNALSVERSPAGRLLRETAALIKTEERQSCRHPPSRSSSSTAPTKQSLPATGSLWEPACTRIAKTFVCKQTPTKAPHLDHCCPTFSGPIFFCGSLLASEAFVSTPGPAFDYPHSSKLISQRCLFLSL